MSFACLREERAVSEWFEEPDFSEPWSGITPAAKAKTGHPLREEFCFREAGVSRFNDVVDDGYDDSEQVV